MCLQNLEGCSLLAQPSDDLLTDTANIILYGPLGSGKSTAATALFNDLYGEMVNDRVLRLKASINFETCIARGRHALVVLLVLVHK